MSSDNYSKIEHFTDHSGQQRAFLVCEEPSSMDGFFVSAREQHNGNILLSGYQFEAFSGSSLADALGKLRARVRTGIATRFLAEDDHGLHMTHHRLAGRITNSGLVIDGRYLSMDELATLLRTHEGFRIRMEINPIEDDH